MKKTKQFRIQRISRLAMLMIFFIALSCSEDNLYDDNTAISANSEVDPEDMKTTSAETNATTTSFAMLTSFDASSGQLPESIAIDHHGNIYLSMAVLQEIWKLDPTGEFLKVVTKFSLEERDPGVLGLGLDTKGNIFVAVSSVLPDMKGVWKVTQNGEKERLAGSEKIAFPNDVAILPNGTVYITDSLDGAVWRSLPNKEAERWVQNESLKGTGMFPLPQPVGANGIVVSQRSDKGDIGGVLVSNTERGQLLRIPILPDGNAGDPVVLFSDPSLLTGLDGLTLDPGGNIYGAVNVGHTIVKFSKDGSQVTSLASGVPLDMPTSLAFGVGREKHTLFITNFSIATLMGPNPQDANPGVVALAL